MGKTPIKPKSPRWPWMLVVTATLAFIALATVDLWWPQGASVPMAGASAEEVAHGAALFQQHCQACHGESARGQNPASPMGGQLADGRYLAPALDATGHAHHHPPSVLFGYLRDGSPAADSPMRSFRDRLSEADMRAVLAYVWSLWPAALQDRYAQSQHH